MARPRKDQSISAEQRIKNAFWEILEHEDLTNITVGMITQLAQCNRGTFYYHFESLEKLLEAVIKEELLTENGVPRGLFYLVCEHTNPFDNPDFVKHIRRFGLVMNRAGQEQMDTRVKTSIIKIWESMLCQEGEELSLETQLILQYTTSGILGLISYLHRTKLLDQFPLPPELIGNVKANSAHLVRNISQAQNMPLDELRDRICTQLHRDHLAACQTCKRMQKAKG